AARALERERFVDLFDGGEPREGVAAFLGKRKPQWRSDEGGQPR
ncbi:enoyl-CoA hydratase, partial [Burkholderia pseudomallei]|nr:enoyl-CoA hydratase [Burkholderia pseudomallei]